MNEKIKLKADTISVNITKGVKKVTISIPEGCELVVNKPSEYVAKKGEYCICNGFAHKATGDTKIGTVITALPSMQRILVDTIGEATNEDKIKDAKLMASCGYAINSDGLYVKMVKGEYYCSVLDSELVWYKFNNCDDICLNSDITLFASGRFFGGGSVCKVDNIDITSVATSEEKKSCIQAALDNDFLNF